MNWHALLNGIFFQVTWFGAVLLGTVAAAGAATLLLLHASTRGRAKADLTLAALLAAVGLGLDTAWIHLGILDYGATAVAPAWIVLLWVAVGGSLNHSLAFLGRAPIVGALLVAPAGAISYIAGAELGGVTIGNPAGLAVVALVWAVLFLVLLKWIVPFVNRCHATDATGVP